MNLYRPVGLESFLFVGLTYECRRRLKKAVHNRSAGFSRSTENKYLHGGKCCLTSEEGFRKSLIPATSVNEIRYVYICSQNFTFSGSIINQNNLPFILTAEPKSGIYYPPKSLKVVQPESGVARKCRVIVWGFEIIM